MIKTKQARRKMTSCQIPTEVGAAFTSEQTRPSELKNDTIGAHVKRPTSGGSLQKCDAVPLDPSTPRPPRPPRPFSQHTVFLKELDSVWFPEEGKVLCVYQHEPVALPRACVIYSSLLPPLPLPVVIHRWSPWPLNPPTSC